MGVCIYLTVYSKNTGNITGMEMVESMGLIEYLLPQEGREELNSLALDLVYQGPAALRACLILW